ncbi:MAG: hypothetical protein Q9195_000046 [Heterodermia aff. obscurata]
MSRSYSHGSDHSRGSRSRGQSHLSVTEAGYQTLPLQGSAGSPQTSTYNPQDPRYPRVSHHGGETASSYLQAGFDTSSFGPSSPSETYIDPSRLTTGFTPSSSEGLDFLNPQSSAYSRTDMGSISRIESVSFFEVTVCARYAYSSIVHNKCQLTVRSSLFIFWRRSHTSSKYVWLLWSRNPAKLGSVRAWDGSATAARTSFSPFKQTSCSKRSVAEHPRSQAECGARHEPID